MEIGTKVRIPIGIGTGNNRRPREETIIADLGAFIITNEGTQIQKSEVEKLTVIGVDGDPTLSEAAQLLLKLDDMK